MSIIPGKIRDVIESINIVKDILKQVGVEVIESNILNPVNGVWSVHLKDKDSHFYTNGKGGTKENALASAYCEFLERLGTGFFFDDFALTGVDETSWVYSPDEVKINCDKHYRKQCLNKDLWNFYDPKNSLDVLTFTDSGRDHNRDIITYPFIRHSDNSTILFPLQILRNIYASNGLSAGNSREETLIQGVSECIERGVKNYIIREGLSLPTISDEYLKSLELLHIKTDVEAYGYKLIVKDASLQGRFPVTAAFLLNQETGEVLSSFGAHPDPYVAIERTMTELFQGRDMENLGEFSLLTDDYDQAADEANIESHFINSTGVFHLNILKESNEEMTLWSYEKGENGFNFLCNLLQKEEYELYYRAYPIGDMWVSQSIIPALSEIYPVEDLEYDNNNRCNVIKSFLRNFDLDKKTLKDVLNWFERSYLYGHDNIFDFVGILSDGYTILADEMELLALLKLKKRSAVKDILNGGFDFTLLRGKRRSFWLCLKMMLNNNPAEELSQIYQGVYNPVCKVLDGVIPQDIFTECPKDFNNFTKHKNMLGLYGKYKKIRSLS